MKIFSKFLLLIAAAIPGVSCSPNRPAPKTISSFDAERYTGEWHEIGRLPNTFERGLVAAKATYGKNADGTISVKNEGLKPSGKETGIEGKATQPKVSDPGKLLVRFDRFPANLFAGDYWILDVNSSYTRALVGSPDYKFLWLLSKDPADGIEDFTTQISKAKELGYDTDSIFYNPKRVSE
ncbi:lipocalin family protein [Luteolibacter sp. AS25]|uniref:lipocalin family protein n=1 Tax=Luteolibacter sp. AS25 TaxID=3135776 RepID=UPI00398B131E